VNKFTEKIEAGRKISHTAAQRRKAMPRFEIFAAPLRRCAAA
jgi:hypothetical protein